MQFDLVVGRKMAGHGLYFMRETMVSYMFSLHQSIVCLLPPSSEHVQFLGGNLSHAGRTPRHKKKRSIFTIPTKTLDLGISAGLCVQELFLRHFQDLSRWIVGKVSIFRIWAAAAGRATAFLLFREKQTRRNSTEACKFTTPYYFS